MSERAVGKPWTSYEDNLLIQAVAVHGENDNWKAVALSVPGRTNKACRKRWLHSLSPNVKKTAWTPEEDQLLLSLYAIHGTKWSVIARNIPGRTDDACSKRYREALDPSLKRDDWTSDEDAKLLEAYSRLGGKWGLIGQELSRSGLGCRNRWRMLERKKAAANRGGVAQGDPSSSTPAISSQATASGVSVQDSPPWDGRSPQYVTPSMLFSSSPNHTQEPHTTAYRPDQILSGAHLAGASSTPPHSQQFQYGSSSLSGALSHPSSVAHSPNPHAYYPVTADLSSTPNDSLTLDARNPLPSSECRQYTPEDFGTVAQLEPIDTQSTLGATRPENASSNSAFMSGDQRTRTALPVHLLSDAGPSVISDSPASPSPVGSPIPLDTPPGSPPIQSSQPSGADAPTDGAHAHKSYYRTDAEKARQASAPRKQHGSQRPTRLSSLLPATADASVRAYACGHRDCWPAEAESSKSAFTTSKELSDHSKLVHNGDLGGPKPFRCGLGGCEKSWKSINGLQYHLQISKVHFQQALATIREPPVSQLGTAPVHQHQDGSQGGRARTSADGAAPDSASAAPAPAPEIRSSVVAEEDARAPKPKRKLHPCPRPGCGKQYKQLSGLRYHLSHGHVEELPMQLDVVPPVLARMVAEKGRVAHE
ncbi:hypothetical protein C8Q77DRAFT_1213751 [Trametes polyzona]|nr:hypothetical protein C8Q77DRAFT_1213751 [Trametes polyzona]